MAVGSRKGLRKVNDETECGTWREMKRSVLTEVWTVHGKSPQHRQRPGQTLYVVLNKMFVFILKLMIHWENNQRQGITRSIEILFGWQFFI